MTEIQIKRTATRKPRPEDPGLVFGSVFTDHMFLMDYTEEHGWHCPRVEPYQTIPLDPAAMGIQYGQSVFEGLKAYRTKGDRVAIFRPSAHAERLVKSCTRMCIPEIDPELFVHALKTAVDVDRDWVPSAEGSALYLRPTVVASEPALGVRPARRFIYYVIMTPGAPAYGADPRLKILVADRYVRAVRGGAGFAKTGGNYGPTLYASREAQQQGFHQVLFLDGVHREYVDEIGIMNFMVRIGDEVVTPPLSDTILAGVTRDSVLTLLRDWGVPVAERPLSIREIFDAGRRGQLAEAWATGTGAGIAPISELCYRGDRLTINGGDSGSLTRRIDAALTGIRYGEAEDPHGWMEAV